MSIRYVTGTHYLENIPEVQVYHSSVVSCLKVKLHLFDLLWICCTTSCTTSPQQIHNKSKAVRQTHNKSTTNLASTTNPQHLDTRCCTTNRKPPASPRQIQAMEFSYDLLWICCSVAANHGRELA